MPSADLEVDTIQPCARPGRAARPLLFLQKGRIAGSFYGLNEGFGSNGIALPVNAGASQSDGFHLASRNGLQSLGYAADAGTAAHAVDPKRNRVHISTPILIELRRKSRRS
jgi:hypothetical protein